MPQDNKKTPHFPPRRSEDLARIDRELVEILLKRVRLIGRSVAKRRDIKLSMVDPVQEKQLWAQWQQTLLGKAPITRNWRRIFELANELGYGMSEPDKAQRGMPLDPPRQPIRIRSEAPPSMQETRLWVTAASLYGLPLRLDSVVLNDPLFELIKALNQLGGGLSWDNAGVSSSGKSILAPAGVVYAGDDLLNISLLACLCATLTGTIKFTGGAFLKITDLHFLKDALLQLGARVTFVTPKSSGLPVRIESSGLVQADVHLVPSSPTELGMALALTAPAFPQGLTLHWPEEWSGVPGIQAAVSILVQCNVDCRFEGNRLIVPKAMPVAPPQMTIPMDVTLTAPLLAMTQLTGGAVELLGRWPQGSCEAETYAGLLRSFGVDLDILPHMITASMGTPLPEPVFDVRAYPQAFPLAIVLSLLHPGDATVLTGPALVEDVAYSRELLDGLSRSVDLQEGILRVPAGGLGAGSLLLTPPHPAWMLACALLGFRRAGLEITNPGDMGRLWPRFWSVYRRLPQPGELMDPGKAKASLPELQTDADPHEKKRKRYIVG